MLCVCVNIISIALYYVIIALYFLYFINTIAKQESQDPYSNKLDSTVCAHVRKTNH